MEDENIVARRNNSKKARKPQKRSLPLRQAIADIVAEYDIMTVRQIYYQCEMRGHVGKTDDDYDKVQRAVLNMRRDGTIPYEKIRDSSRERRAAMQHSGMRAAMEFWAENYRRNYWLEQPFHIEVWCEKDALSGVISPVCARYGVMFSALRGFSSESFCYEAAQDLMRIGKPARIYYIGDHDPSGWWMAKSMEPNLKEFCQNIDITHLGVHPWQIVNWNLPTRRAKTTDKRLPGFIANFGSDLCTEADAIPPNVLQTMVRQSIEKNIDVDSWNRTMQVEQAERQTLDSVMQMFETLSPGTRVVLKNDAA